MIIVSAPAKINLTLRILGKRLDGYHALESIMQLLALADTLTITDADSFSFSCSDAALEKPDNLVVRAAALLQTCSTRAHGAHIHLEKHIPQQAGLGGGSSDAAATLAALNEFWGIRLPMTELSLLAAELGSDVPFFLDGPCALVRGRGEEVIPVIHQTPGYVVLAKPFAGLATARVYAGLHATSLADNVPAHRLPETTAMLRALSSGSVDAIAPLLCNDLEGPALMMLPELFRLRERMLEAGCLAVILCGSGSTLCGLCGSQQIATHAALTLTNDFPWTWAGEWLVFR